MKLILVGIAALLLSGCAVTVDPYPYASPAPPAYRVYRPAYPYYYRHGYYYYDRGYPYRRW
jgi:hypothetical protein